MRANQWGCEIPAAMRGIQCGHVIEVGNQHHECWVWPALPDHEHVCICGWKWAG